jgi:hypothetical protein
MCEIGNCNWELDEVIRRSVYLTGLSQFSHPAARISSDCGFFSGMALKLLSVGAGNPETRQVSRRDVYQARERYLNRPQPQRVYTHRHNQWANHQVAIAFLGSLGLSGYRNHGVADIQNADLWQRMPRYKGRNRRHGIMFNLARGAQGHWAAVLQIRGSGSALEFRIYDSSGIPLDPSRSLSWLPLSEAIRRYTGLQSVVSTASP